MSERYLCIHGHFYQPPRENPWLEEVELQDSAYPYHDWNERITAECYAPNTSSRILDTDARIIDIVNNYSKISFNFGPTLLSWIEQQRPDIYQAIIEADRLSMEHFSGHGSALAQVYNHMIMPLADRRDKYTQVIWGIEDFKRRFERSPEGMWLPETAVDMETLEVLAEQGIIFTILAPHQAKSIRNLTEQTWQDVRGGRIDPTMPYVCKLMSGRNITIFFYDGPISRDVAFGGLLKDGKRFADRLLSVYSEKRHWPQIVHIATDGETYGHHQRSGDMALAYCIYHVESKNLARLTNYGEYLEKHPPTHEVEIIEDSSWSCVHGIERWRNNCGCHSGLHRGWTQAWRAPLREAMDWLGKKLAYHFANEASRFLKNPWEARDEYIRVILEREKETINIFLKKHLIKDVSTVSKSRILKLLEMQRNAMLIYTSCGWFFDDISGIETVQVMQYASMAMQYLKELFDLDIEEEFTNILTNAPSNRYEDGSKVYIRSVKPASIDLFRVGAHYAISSIFEEYPEQINIFCYSGTSEIYDRLEAGRVKLVTGKARIQSDITWEGKTMSFAVLHLGDQNINGGVRDYLGDDAYKLMHDELKDAFEKGDIPDLIRKMDSHFGTHSYSIWHLFRDEQRKILNQLLHVTYEEIESSYRQIYEHHYTIMNFFNTLQAPLPRPLAVAVEYIVNFDLKKVFDEDMDVEKLEHLVNEIKKWSLVVDKTTLGYVASEKITTHMENISHDSAGTPLIEKLDTILMLIREIPLELDLWKAQNIYFSIGKEVYEIMKESAERGDERSIKWVQIFRTLGYYLGVKME